MSKTIPDFVRCLIKINPDFSIEHLIYHESQRHKALINKKNIRKNSLRTLRKPLRALRLKTFQISNEQFGINKDY